LLPALLQAEKEERERRRAEALAARRYPIDDMEHLTEQVAAATAPGAGGEEPQGEADAAAPTGPLQLDLLGAPCSSGSSANNSASPQGPVPAWRPAADGQHLAMGLYVADTLSSFSKQLGLRGGPISLQALMGHLMAAGGRGGEVASQVWLSDLYTQIMEVREAGQGNAAAGCWW
jgi:hypothetical protein